MSICDHGYAGGCCSICDRNTRAPAAPSPLVEELERAAKGATPAPWEYEDDYEGSSMGWIVAGVPGTALFDVNGDSAEQAINAALVVTLRNKLPDILTALRASPSQTEDAKDAEIARLRAALEFYADPKIYEPHPHGPAFDRRDLSFCARTALGATSHE